MQNAREIIDRLGGTSAVASAMRLTPSTVSSWKTSGRIPNWRLAALSEIANQKGVPLPIAKAG